MHRPVHFEYHSSDPEKTNAFFKDIFGWEVSKFPGPVEYFLVKTGASQPGIDGGVMRSKDGQPRTINTIEVENVDACLLKIQAAGGQVCLPKMAIPGVGWLAYAMEPMGNLFGIMHSDPSAA
jgi:predicted enzyme related to lactoylglutathione lyase